MPITPHETAKLNKGELQKLIKKHIERYNKNPKHKRYKLDPAYIGMLSDSLADSLVSEGIAVRKKK